MNQEQVMGIIRHSLTAVGGFMIAKGLIDETTVTEIIGAAATLVGVVWSWWAKLKSE